MIITAKSSVQFSQMEDKKLKGAKFIELHLNVNDMQTEEVRKEVIKNMLDLGLEINVCHTPIFSKYQLEGLLSDETFIVIENTCKLAQDISEVLDKEIQVVMHFTLNKNQLEYWGLLKTIQEKLDYLLKSYPNIKINLENLMFITYDNVDVQPRPNFGFQNIELCKKLREVLDTDRIGTVLDTCHALASIKMTQELRENGIIGPLNIRDYFINNKQYLNVIHLSNSIDYGIDSLTQKKHGVGFETDEDIQLLHELLGYIDEIDYKGIVTLEVQEDDYLDSKVYPKLASQIKEYQERK